jgi:Transposase IS66 family
LRVLDQCLGSTRAPRSRSRNGQARRLIKRLKRHRGDRFTFLAHARVPFDNKHAEREVGPAVIIRNNGYGNRQRVITWLK